MNKNKQTPILIFSNKIITEHFLWFLAKTLSHACINFFNCRHISYQSLLFFVIPADDHRCANFHSYKRTGFSNVNLLHDGNASRQTRLSFLRRLVLSLIHVCLSACRFCFVYINGSFANLVSSSFKSGFSVLEIFTIYKGDFLFERSRVIKLFSFTDVG